MSERSQKSPPFQKNKCNTWQALCQLTTSTILALILLRKNYRLTANEELEFLKVMLPCQDVPFNKVMKLQIIPLPPTHHYLPLFYIGTKLYKLDEKNRNDCVWRGLGKRQVIISWCKHFWLLSDLRMSVLMWSFSWLNIVNMKNLH